MKPDEGTERLLEEILVDAYGEDEQLWAFRQAFEDEVAPPLFHSQRTAKGGAGRVGLALGRLDEPSAFLSDLGDEAGGLIEQARRLFLRDGDHRRIVAPRPQIESPT